MEDKRKLKFIFIAFALLLVFGTLGYMILLKVSLVDALYMTVIPYQLWVLLGRDY